MHFAVAPSSLATVLTVDGSRQSEVNVPSTIRSTSATGTLASSRARRLARTAISVVPSPGGSRCRLATPVRLITHSCRLCLARFRSKLRDEDSMSALVTTGPGRSLPVPRITCVMLLSSVR